MEVVHPRCCGLDVHKRSISACVVIREHGRMEKLERRFGTFTRDLEDLAEWLAQHQVTHLAMEATGVYWKPVWKRRWGFNIPLGSRRFWILSAANLTSVAIAFASLWTRPPRF